MRGKVFNSINSKRPLVALAGRKTKPDKSTKFKYTLTHVLYSIEFYGRRKYMGTQTRLVPLFFLWKASQQQQLMKMQNFFGGEIAFQWCLNIRRTDFAASSLWKMQIVYWIRKQEFRITKTNRIFIECAANIKCRSKKHTQPKMHENRNSAKTNLESGSDFSAFFRSI